MCRARDPHLLAVDDVALVRPDRPGLELGGIRAGGRLGHAERLQAKLALGDLRQVLRLLLGAAVPQNGAHRVHLGMARAGGAAAAMDRL